MDSYSEQLVTKVRTATDTVKIVIIMLLSALIASAAVFFAVISGAILLLLLGIGVIFLGIWLVSGMSIEYEYIITNTDLDIDKIIGKRKRKRMITIDLTRAEDFAPLVDTSPDCDVIVQASSGIDKNIHYLLAEHSDYGKVKVIFNPNKKTKETIAAGLPGTLRSRMENENGK